MGKDSLERRMALDDFRYAELIAHEAERMGFDPTEKLEDLVSERLSMLLTVNPEYARQVMGDLGLEGQEPLEDTLPLAEAWLEAVRDEVGEEYPGYLEDLDRASKLALDPILENEIDTEEE